MELSLTGKTRLKNEFKVSTYSIIKLFEKHSVYVFGYGSLLYPSGWRSRFMKRPPKELITTNLSGFERGPFGLYGFTNFYGIIRTKGKHLNGIVAHIKSPTDYYNLMLSEFVVGLHQAANYRIVDVTEEIDLNLPKRVIIHTVTNRPINRTKILTSAPSSGYYDSVIRNIKKFHTEKFVRDFLNTGGFKNNREVKRYLEKGWEINISGKR